MVTLLVSILPPQDEWEFQTAPFTLCDPLTISDAAMVWGDRHPRPPSLFTPGGMWGVRWTLWGQAIWDRLPKCAVNLRESAGVDEIEKMIGKGATNEKYDPEMLEIWQSCWSVYCTFLAGVEDGSLPATKPVYLANGRINGVLTEIPLCVVLDHARQRGDAGEIFSSLLTWYEREPSRQDVRQLEPAAPEVLQGKALYDELDKWTLALWGKDLTKLPNRDELLSLARNKPEFSKVNQLDIRALRRRLAPKKIRKGGARLHRSRRGAGN
jgi:hypothetical protein